jgi:ATP-dependent helicase/nuclease subunit A
MTVHGAKGLEANTVVLADTTTTPGGPRDPRLLTLENGALVWATARANDVDAMMDARALARQDARDEYRRLLYVAMTRAAERLVICGARGKNKIPEGCWYQLVENAMADKFVREAAEDGSGEVLRYRKGGQPPADVQKNIVPAAIKPTSVTSWLLTNVTSGISRPRAITPSSVEDDDAARPFAAAANANALLRGTLVHRLLQSLPDIPAARRAKAAEEYLARKGKELDAEQRQKIAEQVLVLLDNAQFSGLFLPGSRAEIAIVGRLKLKDKIVTVSGQVDRLAVTQASVLIGDFKTDRAPPQLIEDVPRSYIRQLALYRAVLKKLYPDRPVRAALIWTEVPDLMELSGAMLDDALAGITPA